MADVAAAGWIKLFRSLAQHPLWLKEPFTIGQAWVDLLLLANYHDSTALRGRKPMKILRGQVLTSIESLGLRWGRDRKTVRGWLLAFEADGMLARASAHGADGGYTLLTILNYERYQARKSEGPDDGRAHGAAGGLDNDTDDERPDGRDDGLPTSKKLEETTEGQEGEERARASADANGHHRGVEVRL